MKKKIKIAIIDKHPLICSALSYFLGREADLDVVGSYVDVENLTADKEFESMEVIIMEYSLGNKNLDGLMLIKRILKSSPDVKLIVYSENESIAIVREAIYAGARAYIGKSKGIETILKAIYFVNSNAGLFLPENLKKELIKSTTYNPLKFQSYSIQGFSTIDTLNRMNSLSTREVEVIRCMLEGRSVTEVSIKFSRSRKTISCQKLSAYRKLGIKSDVELFQYRDFIVNSDVDCFGEHLDNHSMNFLAKPFVI